MSPTIVDWTWLLSTLVPHRPDCRRIPRRRECRLLLWPDPPSSTEINRKENFTLPQLELFKVALYKVV